MPKKNSNWITIREETPLREQVTHAPKKGTGAEEFVQNKVFWGLSFVVLVVLTAALIAPAQFVALLKGNLFDTSDYQGVNLITDEGSSQGSDQESDGFVPADTPNTQNSTVVQASTGAVSIQVDPVDVQVTPVNSSGDKSENQQMLEELKRQLNELGASGQQNDASLALLTKLVESELHSAATDADTSAKPIDLSNTQVDENQADVGEVAQVEDEDDSDAMEAATSGNVNLGGNRVNLQIQQTSQGSNGATGSYRTNPYRTQLDPRQILQANLATYGQQGTYAAQGQPTQNYYAQLGAQQNIGNQPGNQNQAYNAQAYNAQLANAQGTPNSGPGESALIALALTFLALVFRKGFMMARTRD